MVSKKMITTTSIIATIVMVAWSLAAILYFTAVSAHFSNQERKEDADKNRYRQPSGSIGDNKRNALPKKLPVRDYDYGNKPLEDHIKRTIRNNYAPKVIKREATGGFIGSKFFRPV